MILRWVSQTLPFPSRITLWALNTGMPTEDRCYLLNMLIFQNFCCFWTLHHPVFPPADFLTFQGHTCFWGKCGWEWVGIWEEHLGELCWHWFPAVSPSFLLLPLFLPCSLQPHSSSCGPGLDSFLQRRWQQQPYLRAKQGLLSPETSKVVLQIEREEIL